MPIDYKSLPKIELHCHLDASLRVSTVAELGRKIGLTLPNPLEPALVAPECCIDLADYLVRIDLALEVMQQRDHLVRIGREVVEDLAADGVIYGEIRFAPQLHLRDGLSMQEVLHAVHEGLKQGEQQTDMKAGLIVCCLRHESGERSLEIAKLAVNNRDKVCALDLAGDEARYIGAPHAEAFALAKREGLRRTVHAGEAAGAESIREALDVLGAERVGHGVRITESDELQDRAKTARLPLEICPLSNIQTRAANSLAEHPIDRLYRKGLHVTVNTDCRTVSLTTITKEFEHLESRFNWGVGEFHQCQRNSAEAAFVTDEVRADLVRLLTAAKAAS
jgi:adenosine deaminase